MKLRLCIGILVAALSYTNAWAQNTAQVSGVVRDQSGAVLPGVDVSLTQTDTGLVRTAVTDETGSYVVSNLPVGPYRLEAGLPGFRTYAQTGIILQVGGNPAINAVLEVGQISDTVEVQADAALVETRSTGVGQVIDNTRVVELPLNARQVTELIILSGAAMDGGAQATNRNYPTQSISIAGGLNNGVTYTLDGAAHNDPFNNLNLPLPFPDALQEFKVETGAVQAQFGQHSAGAVNAVTKSGTNQFHGSLFEFVRNQIFNARNAFNGTRDALKRNQFGGVLGGPIRQNKLFFFGGYQGTIERRVPTDTDSFVPTAAVLAGDFTTVASTACRTTAVNMLAPFSGNRVDPALFSPQALAMVKHLPPAQDQCGLFRFSRKAHSDEHIFIGKVDYQRSDKHTIFSRLQLNDLFTPTDFDGTIVITSREADYKRRATSFVLGDTYLIGSNIVSNFRGTLSRSTNVKTMPDMFTLRDLGVDIFHDPATPKIPGVSVSGGFSIQTDPGMPGNSNSTMFQFSQDLGILRGAHQIGFGGQFLRTMMNIKKSSAGRPRFDFGTTYTGIGLGDFLMGRPSSYGQGSPITYYFRQNYTGFYLQDTWKATSKLTINAGLRWEPYRPVSDKLGRVLYFDQKWFDQGIRSTVYKNAPAGLLFPGDPGVPNTKSMGKPKMSRVAPRLGLSWDPAGNGRMTIRAAYGYLTEYPHFYQFGGVSDQPPWGYELNIPEPAGGFANPWLGIPGGNPFPAPLSPNISFPAAGGVYVTVPLELKPTTVNQWNLSIQRQFGTDYAVSASYIGNNVIHMLINSEGNPAIFLGTAPCTINGVRYNTCSTTQNTLQRRKLILQDPVQGAGYGPIVIPDDGGTRSYHGMLISAQRRRSNGITIQGNYTWSHCIEDNGATPQFQNNGQQDKDRRGVNRGNCAQDRRHNVNMSTVYQTPQFANQTLRLLASGWRLSGIVRLLSGSFMTIAPGTDRALTASGDQRGNQILENPYGDKSTGRYLNPAAFAIPTTGTYGTMGRANIAGPGSIRIDMGVTRTFDVRENHTLELKVEAFNAPNHVNPSNPNTSLNNQFFGQIRGVGDPRVAQMSLKYVF